MGIGRHVEAWILLVLTTAVAAEAETLRTWEDVVRWLEREGHRVVCSADVAGPLRGEVEAERGGDLVETLMGARADTRVLFSVHGEKCVVLRRMSEDDLVRDGGWSDVQWDRAWLLRILAELPAEQRDALAQGPLRLADMPERARWLVWDWRNAWTCGWRPEEETALALVYAPWVLVRDGARLTALPLRTATGAWIPNAAMAGVSPGTLPASAEGLLPAALQDATEVEVARPEWDVGELVDALIPGGIPEPGLGKRTLYVTPGAWERRDLLTCALRAGGCVLREEPASGRSLARLTSGHSAEATAGPHLEPILRRGMDALESALATAYEAQLREELGFSVSALRAPDGLPLAEQPAEVQAHVRTLMVYWASIGELEEEERSAELSDDAMIRVEDGLLVAVGAYGADGGWLRGQVLSLGPSEARREEEEEF